MGNAVKFGETEVRKGDTIRAFVEGVVKTLGDDEVLVDVPDYGNTWVGNGGRYTKVEVTKKAGPPEPTAKDAVVETTDEFGDKARFIKRGNKWYYLSPYSTTAEFSLSWTWDELTQYEEVTVLEANPKPSLPKGHKVRDLNTRQIYNRISRCGTLDFKKSSSNGLSIGAQYTLTDEEAVALAWDILKAYGKVQ